MRAIAIRYSNFFQGKLASLGLVLLYFFLMNQFHNYLRPDQLFLILMLAAVALCGKKGGKQFIIDWAPFTLFLILYDGMRGVADHMAGRINVLGPYQLEQWMFGWLTGSQPLPFLLQWWRESMNGSWIIDVANSISGIMYTAHFLVPFFLAWLLWHTYKKRREFYAFAYSLTILNILALVTFFLYPAAAPWYVWKFGFAIPNVAAFHYGDPSVLVNVDKLLRFPLFSSIYGSLNPNPFAAIPSLHAAYPVVVSYFAARQWRGMGMRVLLVFYLGITWFAAIYLNHHYIVDLLIGALYALGSIAICRRVLMPYVIDRFLKKDSESTQQQTEKSLITARPSLATGLFGIGGMIFVLLLLAHARGLL